jgi:hypothetical protein
MAVKYGWIGLALCALVIAAALPILTYPLGRDQGEFAVIGRGLLDGKIPYVDLWNPKPPAVFLVYAAAIAAFGRTAEAVRAIDLIVIPPTLLAVAWIGRRALGAAGGWLAAALMALAYFNETFWTLSQNDGVVLLPMALAAVCTVKAVETGRLAWAFTGGILSGVVIGFKYPFALFPAALMVWLTAHRDAPIRQQVRAAWRFIISFIVGMALTLLIGALWLALLGALDDLIESARVTAGYTALTLNIVDLSAALAVAVGYRWAHWGVVLALAGVGLIALIRHRDAQRDLWALILMWLAAGIGIMLAQGKAYDYHWLPMLPPLALLAAHGVTKLPVLGDFFTKSDLDSRGESRIITPSSWVSRTGKRARALVQTVTIAGVIGVLSVLLWVRALPYLTGAEDRDTYFSRFQGGEFIADESARMVDFLRERVVPGDSLFIWGFRPEIYYLSGLNPAVRFIFNYPLVADWYPAAWRDETVEVLWAALPPYVLVLQVDYLPWVTGSHDDSHTLLQRNTELNNWLIYNYARDAQIGNFLIWRRMS